MTRMLDGTPKGSSVNVLAMLDRVPRLEVTADELRALSLDHRAGFVLSLVDGTMTVSTVLDLCAMPRDEALQILRSLLDDGVITCGE